MPKASLTTCTLHINLRSDILFPSNGAKTPQSLKKITPDCRLFSHILHLQQPSIGALYVLTSTQNKEQAAL